MAVHCAHCNSTDTQALAQSYQCHNCGGQTSYSGDALDPGRNTNVTATTNTSAAIETTEPAEAPDQPAANDATNSPDWPRHTGGAWYALSDGSKVQGESEALAAQRDIDLGKG